MRLPPFSQMRCSTSSLLQAISLATVLWQVTPAEAQYYFDTNGATAGAGASGSFNWNTSTANWNADSAGAGAGTVVWANGNTAIFSAGTDGTGTFTINLTEALNPLGITVEEGTVNISGAGSLDLGNGDIVNVGASRTLSIASVVTGTGLLQKTGAGSLILSGNNTFTGNLQITAGTLRATTSANALGTGAATVELNGGTLEISNDSALSFNRNTTVTANSTVNIGRATAGAGLKYTFGTLSIGSTLTVGLISGSPTLSTNSTTGLTYGATTLTGNATFSVTNPTASTGSITEVTLGAVTDGANSFGITKTGNGKLTLSAANSFDGPINVTGGLISIAAEDRLSTSPTINLSGGGGLETSASFTLDDPGRNIVLGTGGGTLDVNGSTTLTVANSTVISGTGNLIKADSGTLILGLNNTYTGTTIVNGGTVRVDANIPSGGTSQLGNSTAAIQVGAGSLVTSGAYTISRGIQVLGAGGTTTLGTSASSGTTVFTGPITSNNSGSTQHISLTAAGSSTVEFQGNFTVTTNADADKNSTFQKTGTGTVIMQGSSNHQGNTEVRQGTLVIRHNNSLGATGGDSRPTSIITGAALELQNNITTAENIAVNGTGVSNGGALRSNGGNNTLSGAITLGAASTITSAQSGSTMTLSGTVNANYELTINGAGNTTITGVLSGETGTVAGLVEGRIFSTMDKTTANPGGTQALSAAAGYSNIRTGLLTGSPPDKWADNETWIYTGQIYDADGIFTFAESIDDAVTIKVNGVTVLDNGGWNTTTNTGVKNGQDVNGNAVTNANGATPASSFISPTGDGWYDIEIRFGNGTGGAGTVASTLQGWSATNGFGFSASGSTSFNAANFVKVEDDGSGAFLRTVVSNALIKNGTGILTLANANTYEGGTSITEGLLLATNTSGSATGSGAVTVSGTGRLGGTGTIAGATTVQATGLLSIGADTAAVGTDLGVESLNFNTSLTMLGTATFDITAPTTYDRLIVGGAFTLGASSIIQVNPLSFAITGPMDFDLIDWGASSFSGFDATSNTDLILPTLSSEWMWDRSRFLTEGIVGIIAVPEPTLTLLQGLGLLALLWRRRR